MSTVEDGQASAGSGAGGSEQPWWANKGHHRALAQRNARLAKSRRGWVAVAAGLVAWACLWILFGSYYIWQRPEGAAGSTVIAGEGGSRAGVAAAAAAAAAATSAASAASAAGVLALGFRGPLEGFLAGCSEGCRGFARQSAALEACARAADCGGVTFVPYLDDPSRRYELRRGARAERSTDGQMSFVKSSALPSAIEATRGAGRESEGEGDGEQGRAAEQGSGEEPPSVEDGLDAGASASLSASSSSSSSAAAKSAVAAGADDARLRFSNLEGLEAPGHGPWYVDESEASPFQFRLWRPRGVDMSQDAVAPDALDRAVGFLDRGQPTIFIGLASYRDPMCHETMERALRWARHPWRLRFGVVEQNAPVDLPCFHVAEPCEQRPDQLLCRHRSQIRVHRVSAKAARGPTWGRHRADALYGGETFALQTDAHMYFASGWDEDLVAQWQATGNEYAVMSTYPTDFEEGVTFVEAKGIPLSRTTPTICDTAFVGERGMTKHEAANEISPMRAKKGAKDLQLPILQIWWAAGISFSRGHRVVRAPYDAHLPMLFDGEETSMAYRMWTFGYDFYTFHHSVVFHPYSRKFKPPLFWENEATDHEGRARDLDRSEQRLQRLYGLPDAPPPDPALDADTDLFGIGRRRPLSKFWKVFGIDYVKRTAKNHCEDARTFAIHHALTPFLRRDRKGIDYDKVSDRINFQRSAKRAQKGLAEYASLLDAQQQP